MNEINPDPNQIVLNAAAPAQRIVNQEVFDAMHAAVDTAGDATKHLAGDSGVISAGKYITDPHIIREKVVDGTDVTIADARVGNPRTTTHYETHIYEKDNVKPMGTTTVKRRHFTAGGGEYRHTFRNPETAAKFTTLHAKHITKRAQQKTEE